MVKKVINSIRVHQIPLPGFESYYLTTEGEVWSEKSQKWMSVYKDKTGVRYPRVTILGIGQAVHRLMAITFLGLPPDAGRMVQVDHIDGDRNNNNLSNLRIVSAKAHGGLSKPSPYRGRQGEAVRITIEHEVTGQRLRGTTHELAAHPDVESSNYALYNLIRGLTKRTRAGWTLVESYRDAENNC